MLASPAPYQRPRKGPSRNLNFVLNSNLKVGLTVRGRSGTQTLSMNLEPSEEISPLMCATWLKTQPMRLGAGMRGMMEISMLPISS